MEDMLLNSGISQFDGEEEAFQEYIAGQHSGDKHAGPSGGRGKGKKKRLFGMCCTKYGVMNFV